MEPITIFVLVIITVLGSVYYIYGADTFSDPMKVISQIKKDVGIDKDCVTSDWSDYSVCENGKKKRTRTIIEDPLGDGNECGVLEEESECIEDKDCVVSDWGAWSACKDGTQTQSRTITQPQVGNGKACGDLTNTQVCIEDKDCKVSEWTEWSACKDGLKTQTRTITQSKVGNGLECPILEQQGECNFINFTKPDNTVSTKVLGKHNEVIPAGTNYEFDNSNMVLLGYTEQNQTGTRVTYTVNGKINIELKSIDIKLKSDYYGNWNSETNRAQGETTDAWVKRIADLIVGSPVNLNQYQLPRLTSLLQNQNNISENKDIQDQYCGIVNSWGWWGMSPESKKIVNDRKYCSI